MANPTSIDNGFATIAASTSLQSLALNPLREYSLAHNGKDASGSDAAGLVVLSTEAAPVADWSEGSGRLQLPDGRSVTVGPGISQLYYVSAAGAPTIAVIAGSFNPMVSRK